MQAWIVVRSRDALRVVGGRTLVERLVLQLRVAGVPDPAVVAAEDLHPAVLRACAGAGPAPELLDPSREAPAGEGLILVVEGDRILDPRILSGMLATTGTGELADGETPVGVRVVEGATDGRTTGRLVDAPVGRRVALDTLPTYARELRRHLRPYWLVVDRDEAEARARRILADAAGKGHQEWLVLMLNRPVETWLSRYLCETRITPNQLTLLGAAVALVAAWLFARGALAVGVLVALAAQIVDGLDGRQARIQLRFSPWGGLEHSLDKLTEASWILALGWHFSDGGSRPEALAGALVWLAAATLSNLAGSTYRRRRGHLPDEATRIDAAIRLVASRRNTSTAYLGIGLLLGAPATTFRFLVAFAIVTTVVLWVRTTWLLATRPGGARNE